MPLSDLEIKAYRERGDIIIEPFDERNLGSDTYDVRLGPWFYRENSTGLQISSILPSLFNPFSHDSVNAVWGEAQRATPLGKYQLALKWENWQPDDEFIFIRPGETILAHTLEFIGGARNCTTKMFSRSTVGRALLGVCKCAGRGDVGYFNRWTMEITSFSQHNVIPLKVGMRIAQIEFLPVNETQVVYGVTKGKYQEGADLQALIVSWKPEMMLPRMYKDYEVAQCQSK